MRPLLICRNLTKKFGNFVAVNDLSFEINEGDIFGFLGPNGAGKTTTIKILAGLLTLYSGEIIYKDKKYKSIGNLPRIKFIFDAQNFYENLTAYENLSIIAGLNGKINKKDIERTLGEIGLTGWENKPVRTFSRGMRQRLAIAIAGIETPEFLMLDEPTNGLDIDGILALENYFKYLNSEKGTTILLSAHYFEYVERLSDHILIMKNGKKYFDGNFSKFVKEKINGINLVFNYTPTKDIVIKIENFLKDYITIDSIVVEENSIKIKSSNFDKEIIQKLNKFLFENNILFVHNIPIEKHLSDFFKENINTKKGENN